METVWDKYNEAKKQLDEITAVFNADLQKFKATHHCNIFIEIKDGQVITGIDADVENLR